MYFDGEQSRFSDRHFSAFFVMIGGVYNLSRAVTAWDSAMSSRRRFPCQPPRLIKAVLTGGGGGESIFGTVE